MGVMQKISTQSWYSISWNFQINRNYLVNMVMIATMLASTYIIVNNYDNPQHNGKMQSHQENRHPWDSMTI